jgi:hypothetical protein
MKDRIRIEGKIGGSKKEVWIMASLIMILLGFLLMTLYIAGFRFFSLSPDGFQKDVFR